MASALLMARSPSYASKRAQHFAERVQRGPVDMRKTAAQMALDFPGTVRQRVN